MTGIAIAPRVEGGPGIDITPEGLISTAGGASVTPFRMVPVPSGTTQGPGLVTLMLVPDVAIATAGRVLLVFSASIEVETIPPAATSQGSNFTFLWDGAPIPPMPPSLFSQTAFMEIDMEGATNTPQTFSNQIHLRDVVPASLAGPGIHSLEVQYEGLAAESLVIAFDGSGVLTIEGVD